MFLLQPGRYLQPVGNNPPRGDLNVLPKLLEAQGIEESLCLVQVGTDRTCIYPAPLLVDDNLRACLSSSQFHADFIDGKRPCVLSKGHGPFYTELQVMRERFTEGPKHFFLVDTERLASSESPVHFRHPPGVNTTTAVRRPLPIAAGCKIDVKRAALRSTRV